MGRGRESPGVRVTFFRLLDKKVTKERATLLSATPSLRYGATWGARSRGAPWNSLCAARAAQTATASQLTKHARSDARATPRPARPRRIQRGTGGRTSTQAIASLAPRIAGASASRCAAWAERSDGPSGCPAVGLFGCSAVHPLLAAPASGRLRGGTRVGARVLRALTRRGCPSGARSAKRVPRRTPQPPRRRFAP